MKKYDLLPEIRRTRKWVQMGQQVHKYENLLNRDFRAERPNSKWVTDIEKSGSLQSCNSTATEVVSIRPKSILT